jgi:hypothetical protein
MVLFGDSAECQKYNLLFQTDVAGITDDWHTGLLRQSGYYYIIANHT